jgi:hypothetical protein
VLLGLVGIRLASLGGNADPALEAAVRQELMGEAYSSMVDTMKQMLQEDAVEMDVIDKRYLFLGSVRSFARHILP